MTTLAGSRGAGVIVERGIEAVITLVTRVAIRKRYTRHGQWQVAGRLDFVLRHAGRNMTSHAGLPGISGQRVVGVVPACRNP